MTPPSSSPSVGLVYRVDKSVVPDSPRGEFLAKVHETHRFLRSLPGFVRDLVLEQTSGPGIFNFITLVEWENADAMEAAKTHMALKHAAASFKPQDLMNRLGITPDIGVYRARAEDCSRERVASSG